VDAKREVEGAACSVDVNRDLAGDGAVDAAAPHSGFGDSLAGCAEEACANRLTGFDGAGAGDDSDVDASLLGEKKFDSDVLGWKSDVAAAAGDAAGCEVEAKLKAGVEAGLGWSVCCVLENNDGFSVASMRFSEANGFDAGAVAAAAAGVSFAGANKLGR